MDSNTKTDSSGAKYAETVDMGITERDAAEAAPVPRAAEPGIPLELDPVRATSATVTSVPVISESVTGISIFSGILPPTSINPRPTPVPLVSRPYTKRQIIGAVPWKHHTTTAPEPSRTHAPPDPHATDLVSGAFNFCGVPGAACGKVVSTDASGMDTTLVTLASLTPATFEVLTGAEDEKRATPVIGTLATYGNRPTSIPGLPFIPTIVTAAPGVADGEYKTAAAIGKRTSDDYAPMVGTWPTSIPGLPRIPTLATVGPGVDYTTADAAAKKPALHSPSPYITTVAAHDDQPIPGSAVYTPPQSESPYGDCDHPVGWCGHAPQGH